MKGFFSVTFLALQSRRLLFRANRDCKDEGNKFWKFYRLQNSLKKWTIFIFSATCVSAGTWREACQPLASSEPNAKATFRLCPQARQGPAISLLDEARVSADAPNQRCPFLWDWGKVPICDQPEAIAGGKLDGFPVALGAATIIAHIGKPFSLARGWYWIVLRSAYFSPSLDLASFWEAPEYAGPRLCYGMLPIIAPPLGKPVPIAVWDRWFHFVVVPTNSKSNRGGTVWGQIFSSDQL